MRAIPALLYLCAAALTYAGQTRTWSQSEFEEFQKGTLNNVSVRSDGRVTLAPRFVERFDSSTPYLWALAQDSKGNLFAGGGPGAKLFRITPSGQKSTLTELDELEIHSIVVDRDDGVFVATSPDGKVYRVSGGGKAEIFYEPKAKYIWSMAFSSDGDLYVATGQPGEIHRVSRDGKGRAIFQSDDTHVRSMTLDARGNLIVGTEPGGLVIRVSPAGDAFVLYEMNRKEITAVAVSQDGAIYAAGVGTKQPASRLPAAPAPVSPAPAPAPAAQAGARPAAVPPPPSLATAAITGGSEVYRISPDGDPWKIWSHSSDIVYALAFDHQGRVLMGTGNKGAIYRIDSEQLYTALLNAPPTQVTSFSSRPGAGLFAATGNVGKVYQIGPEFETEGWLESDVFDAGMFSFWGRLTFEGAGRIAVVGRSGNLSRPQKNWSSWSAPIAAPGGGNLSVPPARFFQWKATLRREGAVSPELALVEVAYLPKNVAPVVGEIEITPANYRFPAQSLSLTPSRSLSLPPLGRPRPSSSPAPSLETSTPAMEFAKGFIGARWLVSDENGDDLIYTVRIRGEKETEWKLLREKVREKYLSWDANAFPDGEYRLRVIASDLPDNPKDQALSGSLDSYAFVVDNTAPEILGLTAARKGSKLEARWKARDALSVIEAAEYSVDGGEWMVVAPSSRLSDSLELDYLLTIDNLPAGEHTIAVRVQDSHRNQATGKVVIR